MELPNYPTENEINQNVREHLAGHKCEWWNDECRKRAKAIKANEPNKISLKCPNGFWSMAQADETSTEADETSSESSWDEEQYKMILKEEQEQSKKYYLKIGQLKDTINDKDYEIESLKGCLEFAKVQFNKECETNKRLIRDIGDLHQRIYQYDRSNKILTNANNNFENQTRISNEIKEKYRYYNPNEPIEIEPASILTPATTTAERMIDKVLSGETEWDYIKIKVSDDNNILTTIFKQHY